MIKIANILDGWRNYIDKSEVSESRAQARAKICAVCPNARKSLLAVFVRDSIKHIEGYECSKCGCPLSGKLRSKNEKCPIGKW